MYITNDSFLRFKKQGKCRTIETFVSKINLLLYIFKLYNLGYLNINVKTFKIIAKSIEIPEQIEHNCHKIGF